MEETHLEDNKTDDILIEKNENSYDSNQKGMKRVAQTPPGKDAKKPKLSRESSMHSVVDISDSPQNDAAESPKTQKTPKTPKVSKEEREKVKKEKMEEKERQRVERERALEAKRLEKEKLAEEKRLEKEKKEKERLEKKIEEERKKEEKRKEAEEKKKKEDEEKLKKEEERNKKKREEEEKKEAKRREEEALEEKKRRESANFLNYFSKIEKKKGIEPQNETSNWYRPFEPKDGMTLAPILLRKPISSDYDMWTQHEEVNTIETFIKSAAKPKTVETSKSLKIKGKFFQFHENRRPAYYGTWRKRAKFVTGSNPLAEEEGIDYEVDSDDEWEDEPSDCEECNSDDDADKDDDEDGDEDDGFFVPPCYLSDGEGDEESTTDFDNDDKKNERKSKVVTIDSDEDETSNDAAERKARLAQRAEDWAKRTEKKKELMLKPRAVGPVFNTGDDQPLEFKYMAAVRFY